ncbi:MAG: 2OG-Fe(II) oxygenase [Alphaproteobacteria bacterium]|nr:2OG-Fe(II) oxygenase [Alphaproteobacteria bacterium]
MTPLTDAEVEALGSGDIVVRDDAFGAALGLQTREVLAAWLASGRLDPAGVGRDGRITEVRRDLTAWVDPGEPGLAEAFARFEQLRGMLASDLRIGLHRFAVQAACYREGAWYRAHLDAFRGDPSRVVTAIWYVNPDWTPADGGSLRAWVPGGTREVEPRLDRLVLFLSERVRHEVLPAHRERFALTAWFRGAEAVPLLPDP